MCFASLGLRYLTFVALCLLSGLFTKGDAGPVVESANMSSIANLPLANLPLVKHQKSKSLLTIVTLTYAYTGAVQTLTVPVSVLSLTVQLNGAAGGASSGTNGYYQSNGASITATVAVVPGDLIYIYVGGMGSITAGGYNGGGNPAGAYGATGGGGATDIRKNGFNLYDRILVAGGGGGSHEFCVAPGGN